MKPRILIATALLLVFASSLMALPAHRLPPRLQGEIYSADLPSADGVAHATAIWNLSKDMLTLYVYDRDENVVRTLYSVRVEIVQRGDEKQITVPARGLSFAFKLDDKKGLLLDGKPTKLVQTDNFLPVSGASDTPEVEIEAVQPCQRQALRDNGTASSTVSTLSGRQLKPVATMSWCGVALILNGCCDSCFCVHRSLDLPSWVDSLCCGGGC
ncbi:MAG TPA: hypothetical protein VGQ46_00875 [Thermoanaerobaculia bacterium]|jgi:hypothetical protein|nr:hypothetical protein [Thermoanaerobaculia bacterium]